MINTTIVHVVYYMVFSLFVFSNVTTTSSIPMSFGRLPRYKIITESVSTECISLARSVKNVLPGLKTRDGADNHHRIQILR